MRTRTPGALVVLFVAVSAAACGAGGSEPLGGGFTGDDDASVVESGGDDDAAGPSPDGLVLGDDAGDDGPSTSKSCANLPDGTLCGPAPDICHDAPVCMGGACAPAAPKPDGFVCAPAPDACHTDGKCSKGVCGAVGTQPESYNWQPGDDTARCCGGKPVHTNTDTNCGVCGIACNAGNGESCQTLGGHWFCRGCIASAACWSHCCSTSFSPASCAASDCNGNCSAQYCPAGTHCVSGNGVSSDYCSY